jgi:hypothetical protein
MKAIIIYPQTVTFLLEVPAEQRRSLADILSYCFEATQLESPVSVLRKLWPQPPIKRNSMVGDVYIVQDRFFVVDEAGFVEVSEVQSIKVQALGEVERLRAWRWIEANTNVGAPIGRIERGPRFTDSAAGQ